MSCRHKLVRALLKLKLKDAASYVPVYVRMESDCPVCKQALNTLRSVYEQTSCGALSALQQAQREARRLLKLSRCEDATEQLVIEELPYPNDSGWGEREWGWFRMTVEALAALGGAASVYTLRHYLERRRVLAFEDGMAYESFVQTLDGVSGLCVREGKVWRTEVRCGEA